MELLEILHQGASQKEPITHERIKLLCSNLSHLDPIAGRAAYNLILSYHKKRDTSKKIGSVNKGIPYYGEEIEDEGIIFSASELPDELLLYLEVMAEASDLQPITLADDDDSVLGFILTGVFHKIVHEAPNTIHHNKFVSSGNAKHGVRFDTTTTYEGYKVRIAQMGNIQFAEDQKLSTCFHDGHPFDGRAVYYPKSYIYKDGVHIFIGKIPFCSIWCLYAYISQLRKLQEIYQPVNFRKSEQLVMLMFKLMFPDEVGLRPAPDACMLDVYGGPYSITEFRRVTSDKRFVDSGNVLQEIQTSIGIEI